MPRSTRDSDEDVETRTGRKTRAGTGSVVPESPVRRSSRIKPPTKQNDSSPDLSVTESSITQTTRSFRSRAGTIDSNSLEIQRRLRSSKTTVDMNEVKDSEVITETQPKKMTRRSIAAMNASETPKANTRTRRLTRAGSETKSTPTRVTRKTRASSMDPESTIEQPTKERYDSHVLDTPSRAKRRASVLPSESTVIEEEEKLSRVDLEKTVIEEDESSVNVSLKNGKTSGKVQESKNKSNEEHENIDKATEEKGGSVKGPFDHSSEHDCMEVSENVINEAKPTISDQSNILEKDKDYTTNVEDTLIKDVTCNISTESSCNIENVSKEVESKDESILHVSLEEGEINTSNKENECLNNSNSISKQNKNENILDVSMEEGEINTSNKENECSNIDVSMSEQNKNISNTKKLNQEASITVLDSSTKEDKNAQYDDNIKLKQSCLMECSVSVLNCDNLIQNFNTNNESQINTLHKENDSVPILDIKEIARDEEHDLDNKKAFNDKSNVDSITVMESSNVTNTESHKILSEEEGTTPKEQPTLDDQSNDQIKDNTIIEEEKNLETVSQNANDTKEINCPQENVSVISSNALDVSVNPTENLVDTPVKEDNCTENIEVTEISNLNKDVNESTISKDSHTKQDDIPSTNENQDSMSTSPCTPSSVILHISDESIKEPISNTEQTELLSPECLIDLKSPTPSNSILETNDSSTVTESHDVPEEDLPDDEESKRKSLETPKTSKAKSVTELNISKTEEEAQKNDVQTVDDGDNISSAGMLFQDISADEWKQKQNTEFDKEAWLAAEELKGAKDKETFDYDSDDTVVLKSKMDYLNDRINKSNEMQGLHKDSTQENDNIDSLQLSQKKIKGKLKERTSIDKYDVNVSLQNISRKEKSLNETGEDTCNISKSDSVKSSDKQLEQEEEEEITLSQKESEDHNKSESKLRKSALDKKQKKNRALNTSLDKKSKLKQKPNKYNRLHISSSGEEDEANSDTDDDSIGSSNSDTKNKSLRIPRFLFKHRDNEESDVEPSEDGSSKRSIDSDINAEYNLDGISIGKFSDDDIPGDECRASESESSDPDDNGSDLADFVVDDDEVEEEEEEDEDEDGDGEEEQEENEEEDHETKDEKVTEDENEKKEVKSKDTVSIQEKNKDISNKSLNMSNIKSDKKKNQKQKIISETNSAELAEDEIASDSKINTSIKLDSTLSEKKKKKKQKLNENNEIVEETPRRSLNDSEVIFKRKPKGVNVSLTCSTPKTDVHKHEQFKHNISSEKKKRKYIEKISVNYDREKIRSQDLLTDDSDNNKITLNSSLNARKRNSIEKNISADSLELVKDTNLPRPLLSKKAHLNKTMSPSNETPTTKYLKKQKLNDSAPFIKLPESKGASENTSLTDKKEDNAKQDETNAVVNEKTVDMLELDSSLSAKRKKSIEATDLGDEVELRQKKIISKTGQTSEVDEKVELHVASDNEKENSECILKVDDGKKKKKKKKNKKNKSFTELDTVDIEGKMVEENVENNEKMEVTFSIESKKSKKKNKNKENIESEGKNNDKLSNTIKNYGKFVEIDIPNKKKKKVTTEVISPKVKEQSKKLSRKNISKGSTLPNVEISDVASESSEFYKSRHEALEAAKRAAESIKSNEDMRKKKRTGHLEKVLQQKESKIQKVEQAINTRGIKRLSIDVIENISDVPMRPLKKQKLSSKPAQTASHITTKSGFTESTIVKVKKNVVPSNSGGTTEFEMDNTLDSIYPSDKGQSREEMSYLFGRDPSILAYGQRPCPSRETKKNLLSEYEIEEFDSVESTASLLSDSQSLKTIKVYLRLKPFPRKLKLLPEQQEAYKIINSTTLATKLPCLENNSSFARTKSSEITSRTYTFTQTFGPETTQLELFDQAIKQQMVDFLAGQSCNVMTYGTTNSGKSYTLQGTITSPGIIPRALEFVFSIISPKPIPSYKPVHHCDAVFLNSLERAQELEAKTKLLSFSSIDKNQYINTYKQMQKILQEESPLRPSECSDAHYAVWVSFAEIYNETIYDLLTIDCQKKKVPLKLATDNRGKAFIKGLNSVYVNSGAEAYQVLMAGQYNLKVAATALNARSSRSHCIFTIKLLKYYSENVKDSVDISTFSFCDLAGSERLKKTLNIGDRLKEAQNINTSLLVLGKCLKSIYESQSTKLKSEPIIGPFRESKLTRLFQKALSGREQIALIVNVNPLPNLYIETQNVLNFAAIAKKIIIEPKIKEQRKANSRFSKIVKKSIQSITNWDDTDLESTEWTNADTETEIKFCPSEEYEDLLMENKELRKEIIDLKNMALTRDFEIRQEMADSYSNIIKKLENDWKARMRDVEEQQEDTLQWSIKQVEEYYKQKMANLSSRKRQRRSVEDDEDDDESISPRKMTSLEFEISHLTSKVVCMKDTIHELKKNNQALTVEKNKAEFELSLTKDALKHVKSLLNAAQKDLRNDDETENYIEEIKSQLSTKEEHVKKLKEFLNEAKEEYISITNDARTKEAQIKEQEELMVEYEEKIEELQEQLDRANYCLADKTKTIESLEDNAQLMLDKITELENKLEILNEKHEDISCKQKSAEISEDNVTSKSCEDIVVKEELILEEEIVAEEAVPEETEITADTKKTTSEENMDQETETAIEHEKLKSTEDKSCQTYYFPIEPDTQEAIIQTSFVEADLREISVQTSEDVNYEEKEEEFKKLVVKCNEVEAEYEQAHAKVENDLKVITNLQQRIAELDKNLDEKQKEKETLESLLEENIRQQKQLQEKLEEFDRRERDKDDEITAMQKELKHLIQAKDVDEKSVTSMEIELKDTLRMLTDAKKALSYKEQQVENLETRLKSLEQTTKFLELLQKEKEEQQAEREKLREVNEMLKESLATKEREMEEFIKNRNETLNKYDNLIKSLQEDLERQKREVMRYQELFCRQTTPTPSKDECKKLQSRIDYLQEKIKNYESSQKNKENEIVSEDDAVSGDHVAKTSARKKGRKKDAVTLAQPEVIDLSGSESKRDVKRTVLLPPSSELSEKKRGTRKKKLFVTNDESLQDIEPVEMESTPSIPLRSLRSRRK
ncbi:hypothetical protein KPH14_004675 [Odynerus spinipes]|uniref:Kinesin motor domain-containing protein n=1 Tax=Odynerus spinipes TaxID=1348599 RepID=A0AAD9RM84_9HYME|nr:hypothetical protein KPH14_004675 [Odynerus spinipes]